MSQPEDFLSEPFPVGDPAQCMKDCRGKAGGIAEKVSFLIIKTLEVWGPPGPDF